MEVGGGAGHRRIGYKAGLEAGGLEACQQIGFPADDMDRIMTVQAKIFGGED